MQHIFVSDIFGRTPALDLLAEQICGHKNFQVIDPYQGELLNFHQEERAYQHFLDTVGLEHYYEYLQEMLSKQKSPYTIIAFSIGASICWRYVSENNVGLVHGAHLFYGSQVRNMITLSPNVLTTLYLPVTEPHFSITQFIKYIEKKPYLNIKKTKFHHGFMNKCSQGFDQQAYQYFIDDLKSTC